MSSFSSLATHYCLILLDFPCLSYKIFSGVLNGSATWLLHIYKPKPNKYMASIIKRLGPKGTVSYRAEVRRKGYPSQVKTFSRKGDAEKWARKVERQIDKGTWRDIKDADSYLMADAIKKYLAEVTPRKKISTQKSEAYSAKKLIKAFGQLSLVRVTPSRVNQYVTNRFEEVSANSVRIELALLSNLFNVAKSRWGYDGLANPVTKDVKPKTPHGRCPVLSGAQIVRLVDECRKSPSKLLHQFVLLALHTGCRSTELRAVRWSQINFDESSIYLAYGETKTGDGRTVPLTTKAKEILLELKDNASKEQGIGNNGFPVGVIFPAVNNPNKPRDMHKHFNLAVKKAGLDNLPGLGALRIHDLRHLCATFLLMEGADLETVREILGHRDISTTQKYLHVVNEHKKKAIDKIGNLGF